MQLAKEGDVADITEPDACQLEDEIEYVMTPGLKFVNQAKHVRLMLL
jgi:hypothetical protein